MCLLEINYVMRVWRNYFAPRLIKESVIKDYNNLDESCLELNAIKIKEF